MVGDGPRPLRPPDPYAEAGEVLRVCGSARGTRSDQRGQYKEGMAAWDVSGEAARESTPRAWFPPRQLMIDRMPFWPPWLPFFLRRRAATCRQATRR